MSHTNPQVILITGTSSGLGLHTAVKLATLGHRVFASMRDLSRIGALADAAHAANTRVETLQLDVTDEASRARAVREVEERAGHIDVLVNNAGYALAGFFEDLSQAELRAQFEPNFFGLAALIQTVLPSMRRRGRGRIVNVSSIAGRFAMPVMSAYCASKFALEGLSEALRHELRPQGIDVVLVEPGAHQTDAFTRNRRVTAAVRDPSSPNHAREQRLEKRFDRLVPRMAHPRVAAAVIARAAITPQPRLRYVVGPDAYVQAVVKRWVPFGLIEPLIQVGLQRLQRE